MPGPDAALPPFERLQRELLARIAAGELTAGTRLPTVRALAAESGLAPNTVARAYRELEERGVLEARGRAGTFVAWSSDGADRAVEAAARDFAALVERNGADAAQALALVRAALGLPPSA